MKLREMAEILNGLATTLERFLGKTAVNDLRLVSECFGRFGDESVSTFCNFVINARDGKPAARRGAAVSDGGRIVAFVNRIRHYLEHRDNYDYAAVRQIAAEVAKLKIPEIKAIGEEIGCPLSERTKAQMVSRLEDWLTNIKLSADQSSFTLAPASVP